MTPNETPDQSPKPEWFELTENQTPSAGLRKVNKVLPITTLVVAGALILGGSFFAQANDETSAPTQISEVASSSNPVAVQPTAVQPTAVKPVASSKSLPMPVVTSVAQRGGDDYEDDEEDREHRDRKRGDRERDHDDDDDDRDDD